MQAPADEQSRQQYTRAEAQEDGDRRSWFETMAAHALLGNREEAITAWQRLVNQGFYDARLDAYHPLVASIKDDPGSLPRWIDFARMSRRCARAWTSARSTSGSRAGRRSARIFRDRRLDALACAIRLTTF